MNFDTVSVIGLGYIGLPTAAVLASNQKKVVGVDVNQHAVDTVNRGEIHIVEPGLDRIVMDAVNNKLLRATTSPEPADAFLIAVPTPFKAEGDSSHVPDLQYIEVAAKAISRVLEKGNLVVLESTSPVGTTEKMAEWLAEARPDLTFPQTHGENSDIRIAHCPERVLPGHVVRELVGNDRIIGGMTQKCSNTAAALYGVFVEGECFLTDVRTAEMAKLTENAYRDINIAYANELSMICDKLDIDVWELIRLANHHPRVEILQPGPGVGGHCIAVDPWFIVNQTPEEAQLVATARSVNDTKPRWVISKVQEAISRVLDEQPEKMKGGVSITCLGLAFKPDIDDLRESPALQIAQTLDDLYPGQVSAVEPHVVDRQNVTELLGRVRLVELDVGMKSDIVVMLVDHAVFKEATPALSVGQRLIDTRGVWPLAFTAPGLCET